MRREQVLAILYEMAIVIGRETRVRPLLTTAVQHLLFHTSFPCGLVFLDAGSGGEEEDVDARLDLAIGDLELRRREGDLLRVPRALLRGKAELAERPDLLDTLPCRKGRYRSFLRLPVGGSGAILLIGPETPESPFPLTRIFEPVLENLAKAIVLCRSNEAWAQRLEKDRARAEAAYQDLSHRSELVLESVGEGICGVGLDGRTSFVNPAAAHLLGYEPDELARRPFHEIVHCAEGGTEIPPDGCTILRALREGRRLRTAEEFFRRKDGSAIAVDCVCTPLVEEDRGLGAVVVFQDISERRRAERELRKLNRSLQTISRCNLALVHAREEAPLLQGVCSALVELGGHSLVWTAFVENGAPVRRLAARAGQDRGYLSAVASACGEACTCPLDAAVGSGVPCLVTDLRRGDDPSPWRTEALRRGFACLIALPLRIEERVIGTLAVLDAEPDAFTHDEVRLLEELAGDVSFGLTTVRTRSERDRVVAERSRYLERLRKVAVDTVQAIAAIVELRDPYTAGHQRRVAQLAAAIAIELGLAEERVEGIRFGSLIHDIGKMYVPAEFLNRPGKLTPLELQVIKTHPEAGYGIVKDIDFPWPVAQMIRQHHELLDGSGYPLGLKGPGIILEARILAVADAIEAMVSHRPYRPSRGLAIALAETERLSGSSYDPDAVRACGALFHEGRFAFH